MRRCAACGTSYPVGPAEGAEGHYPGMDAHSLECPAVPPEEEPWNPEAEHGWDYWDLMAL